MFVGKKTGPEVVELGRKDVHFNLTRVGRHCFREYANCDMVKVVSVKKKNNCRYIVVPPPPPPSAKK